MVGHTHQTANARNPKISEHQILSLDHAKALPKALYKALLKALYGAVKLF